MLGISRDITERKEAEEAARAASRAKSAFLAHMSHEIRTPMNAISGMTELILREDLPHTIHEHVLGIKQASANLLSLINDVLDFSKIEAGGLEIVPAEYLFSSLISDVLIIMRMKISEKPILFTVNIDCDIPNRLIGDETRLRQILLNVLGNAANYTNEGFISLTVTGETGEDTVALRMDVSDSGVGIREENIENLFDNFVRLDSTRNRNVPGTGLGLSITKNLCRAMGGDISVRSKYGVGSTFTITIPQKIGARDERFAQVMEPDTKRVLVYEARFTYADSIMRSLDNLGVPGVLAASRTEFREELRRCYYPFVFVSSQLSESAGQVIEEMGLSTKLVLRMEVGEVPAMRNVRTIAMPVHCASIANVLNDVEDAALYNEGGKGKVRFIAPAASVLVVDDVNTNLKVAEGLMLPYQMRVDVCESGAEAVERVREKRYDIIFMDHMMPGMDGIEATGRIRSLGDGNGYYKRVPIIALTANAVSGAKEMFLQNGMDDFLAKPIDIAKLNSLLEKWIPEGKKEKHREATVNYPPANTSLDQIRIEGVDVAAGIALTGGRPDNYIKTLAIFHMDGVDKPEKIRDCVERNDIKLYTTYVHALKSAAASIGAGELSAFVKELEMAGIRGDTGFIRENTERFLRELQALLRNIEAAVLRGQEAPMEESDPQRLRNELLRLREALDNMDAGAVDDIMNALGAILWDERAGELFAEISRNTFLFDYHSAALLVDELLTVFEE